MSFFTPIVPVVPMRSEAAHRSEMVSQFLFGETATAIEIIGDFIKIKTHYDNYQGWCARNQLHVISEFIVHKKSSYISADPMAAIIMNNENMYIPFGTPLNIFENKSVELGEYSIQFQGSHWDIHNAVFEAEQIQLIARNFLNVSYLWGGRTIFGIDCSGFTQQVFRFFNKVLPRDAYQQATLGEVVGFLQEAKCGDLAFFDNAEGKIIHVGILLDASSIIHASGKVRIDKLDSYGIIHTNTGERTHQLRIIKRYQ